jgi:hypothetical protein
MIVIESGFTGTTYPLTNPRIAAYPITGTVTASTAAAGYAGNDANNELTYTAWKPTAVPATWQLSFTSTVVSYCAIAAHNIGSTGGTVQVQEYLAGTFTQLDTHTPTDDSPIVFFFAGRTTDRIRIRVTNAIPTIGVIWFGRALELPQKSQWTGSLPFNEAVNSVYTENVSDGGHVMDRFATRKAGVCAMEVRNVSETWAAANIPALQAHMGALPIFMADRPSAYPKSVVYGSQQEPLTAPRVNVLNAARTLNFNVIANEPA